MEKDYLSELVESNKKDPIFAAQWETLSLMGKLVDERVRLGLTQREVGLRIGVGQSAIARMENDPTGVALSRIVAYANAIGAEISVKRSRKKGVMVSSPIRPSVAIRT